MEIKRISSKEMSSRGGKRKSSTSKRREESNKFNILSNEFLEESSTGLYEVIDEEKYTVFENYSERECITDTTSTDKIAHIIHPEKKYSYWISLCGAHLQEVQESDELEILEMREPIIGESS